ncbi:hypothetical protein [Magnetospirillum sp. UT-4]|uniref:hypothetical protein n=1 Tax=Magnetospirillum sp. UT-4 TaxID=2681467 RepID=UPI00137C4926|nr:hypothetical protein [Magnetospirillum sp. UT-4]CAA7619694.1 conserved hypothetical protein [Magnetospirillum sp. UT-4]
MSEARIHPLSLLSRRLHLLGKVLALVCCAWIAVVGPALMRDLNADQLGNHRSPQVQERVKGCDGDFASRYACTDLILLAGHRDGAVEVLRRLGLTLMLPTIAWAMWRAVMDRTDRLCRSAVFRAAAARAAGLDWETGRG